MLSLSDKKVIHPATQVRIDKFIDLSTSNASKKEILVALNCSEKQYQYISAMAKNQMSDPARKTAYAMKLSNILIARLNEVRKDYDTCEDSRAKANYSRILNDTIKLYSEQFSKLGILPKETKLVNVTTLNLTPIDIENEIKRLDEDN